MCKNQLSAFYLTENVNVNTKPLKILNDISEVECLNLCTNNMEQNKRNIHCGSIAYDTKKRKCSIYKNNRMPDGELLTKFDNGIRFFDKFCLSSKKQINLINLFNLFF